MSYETEITTKTRFIQNVVVEVDGVYYGKYEPDSGLTIAESNRILSTLTINPTTISLRDSVSTINSTTVTILDKDGVFSNQIGLDEGALIDKVINVYLGRLLTPLNSSESFDFSEYKLVNTYNIAGITKSNSFYKLRAKSVNDKTQVPVFDAEGELSSAITDTDTTVVLTTEEDVFTESTGRIRLGNEVMEYSAKVFDDITDTTTFTISARGSLGSTAEAHSAGVIATFLYELEDNPIDILLQLLISEGGGGTYDVYPDGAGIDESLVDIAGFEAIRDEFFLGETFGPFYISNEVNLLKFIEKELLVGTNTRLVEDPASNKLSLAILDQSDLTADVEDLDESNTLPNPGWKINKSEILNTVKLKWNWSEGTRSFSRVQTFKDQNSIDRYGEIKGNTIELKGVQATNGGASIASDRARRYLERFSTPRVEIRCRSFMNTSFYKVGDKVRFTSSQLPQEGAGLGMSSVVEIISRAINFSTGLVSFTLRFTSYSNLRIGLISPSPAIATSTAQNRITVTDTTTHAVGYKYRLWDEAAKAYKADPVNELIEIDGSELVFQDDWATTLPGSDLYLFFADYSDSSSEQQAKYAYVAPDSGFFADSTKAYQIIL